MNPRTTSAFDLPHRLAHKAGPTLIADDDIHFAAIDTALTTSIRNLTRRLEKALRAPAEPGQPVVERDMEIRRIDADLRALRRYGIDLCLGRIVRADGRLTYIGRLGLLDDGGNQLLVDWRSPIAEPFFGATHGNPMGLTSRRRYRWSHRTAAGARVSDYWDEVFVPDDLGTYATAALDDQSAFIASLASSRSPQMRDVLGTIAADQDAIVRAGSGGALVVDGGPGTGKTVVALHRSAYLLYSDPRLRHGVLFIGPHEPYLAYVADVLPSLGEDSVQLATIADLVPEGSNALPESDPMLARLKSSADLVAAIDRAVRFYETPPTSATTVATDFADIPLTRADWAEAFDAPEPGVPHNEAREVVWDLLLTILADKCDATIPRTQLRQSLERNDDLRSALDNAWTLVEPDDLVADLWSVPAYLRMCAPWLKPDEVRSLQRGDAKAWTVADLPLLDAARHRLGDSKASSRQRRHTALVAAERERMSSVIDDLIASNEYADGEGLMSQLRQHDLQEMLVDETAMPTADPDLLAGPFAHIVVDEAQELTDAQWQMLLQRCPSRSFTIVGDRAQARGGFTESWTERLERVGLTGVTLASLSVNYRTPEEIMVAAEPVIRAVLPDANVPTSIRSSGTPVGYGMRAELASILDTWLDENSEGTACVIGIDAEPPFEPSTRVRWSTPQLAKGLEFDLVVLLEPETFGSGIEGGVDRYVAMTRATNRLVILT